MPRESGYLGRLRLRDKPITVLATGAANLPAGVVHGPLCYRVRIDGRDYVNPTLVAHRGERVRVTLDNRLDAPTVAHWHGISVDARNDGAGSLLVAPRETFAYDFTIGDRGALYWYHPHPHGATAAQVYNGLYGLLDVEDVDQIALRDALDLVPGRTEFSLVFQDRRASNTYAATPHDLIHGFLGDAPYVNGRPCPHLDVGTRLYRLRMLNACNARTLLVAFRSASGTRVPFVVVGNDAGFFSRAQRAEQAFVATAERLDVLVDLRDAAIGETIVVESSAFDPMHAEIASPPAQAASDVAPDLHHGAHAHVGHGAATWSEGAPRTLMTLRVRNRVHYDRTIPMTLSTGLSALDVANARERPIRLGHNKGRWRINDRVFVMNETPIEVTRNTTEVWLLRNYHTSMPHAMHLHGFHFEVLERETSPDFLKPLAIDDRGRLATDLGRKDTVLVWPGESVRVAIDFTMKFDGPQTYVFHCHNLEHEDGGMMLGVKVA